MDKKKCAILHISDLHIIDHIYTDNAPSRFQKSEAYLENLVKTISEEEKKYGYKVKSIIVTGDVAHTAEKEQYDEASVLLSELCSKLKIDKKNVIIVPGNHDISWSKLTNYLKENRITNKNEFYKHSDIKFEYFKNFYDAFFEDKKNFNPQSAIVDYIEIEELGIVVIGLNSVYKESQMKKDHVGFININTLKKELEELKDNLKDKFVIAVLHHSPIPIGDEKRSMVNWDDALTFLQACNINTFITGHSHVSQSVSHEAKDILRYFVTGSIGIDSKDIANTFLILREEEDELGNVNLSSVYYKRQQEVGEREYWQELTSKTDAIQFVTIKEKKGKKALESIINSDNFQGTDYDIDRVMKSTTELENENIKDKEEGYKKEEKNFLIETIKKNNLYTSGHFHWSKSVRSHSYIHTNFLFENYECLEKIKNCYFNLFRHNDIKSDLLIGYSMQGNIIGSILAIEERCDYAYIPDVERMYSDYEKKLPEGEYKTITLVLDMVYSKSILVKIIRKLRKQYAELEKINICTLFYSRTNEFELKEYEGVAVCLYYIFKLNLNKCPYNDKDAEKCIIFSEKLEHIHVLYSEEEQNENN